MAYPISTGDIVQITVKYAQSNIVEMMNVLHYRYTSVPQLPDGAFAIEALIQSFAVNLASAGWESLWAPLASNLVNIDRYIGQKVYPTRWAQVEFDVATPGSVVANPLPGLAQFAITKRGEVAARYSVGGIRVPGLAETMEEGSQLTNPAMALATTMAMALTVNLEPVGAQTWEPIVYRRGNPGSSVRVAEAFAQRTLRTQRTRIAFRGI